MTYRDVHKDEGHGERYDGYIEQPWQRWVWAREQQILLDVLDRYFGDREIHLLDFACGTGRILQFLEEKVETSVGVDVSIAMLDLARRKLKRTQLIEADITTKDTLPGEKYNLITAFRFFLNAEPPLRRQAMHALSSLLADDGILVFNNHGTASSPYIKALRLCSKATGRTSNAMSVRDMHELTRAAQLRIVEMHPASLAARRIGLPPSMCRFVERAGMKRPSLHRLFDEQVAVCRHDR